MAREGATNNVRSTTSSSASLIRKARCFHPGHWLLAAGVVINYVELGGPENFRTS
jgi:hypothetical protein